MAEEVKKAPKPVDVNSAKYKLGKIAADAYVDAIEAKKRGEKVAWVSSNFPVEIPETMGIATVYPENQAAGIAARGAGTFRSQPGFVVITMFEVEIIIHQIAVYLHHPCKEQAE